MSTPHASDSPNGNSPSADDEHSILTDAHRLQALRRYESSEVPQEDLDRLTRLAAGLFDAPVALLSLIDDTQRRFMSAFGTGADTAPAVPSVCRSVLASGDSVVVEDLDAQDRFASRDLVPDAHGLRFYAGVPLTTLDGHCIGTICVCDTEPQSPDPDKVEQLQELADMAMEAFERHEFSVGEAPGLSQTVIDHLPGIFYVVGTDGRMKGWNARFEDLSGYSGDELSAAEATSFFRGADCERVEAAIEEVFETGNATVEADFVHKSGEEFPMLLTGVRTRLQGKTRLVGMGVNISERKKQEEERRVLAEAVRQVGQAILITEGAPLDEPGPRIRYVNPAFEEMSGYREEEILGCTPRLLQGPKTDRDVLDDLREQLEAGNPVAQETVNYRKDGTPYIVQWNISPVYDEEGTLQHWVSVQRDVTAERRRQQALQERELRFRQLTENISEVFWLRTDDELLYVSPAIEDVFGRAVEELEHDVDAFFDWVHPDDRADVESKWEALVDRGEAIDTELRVVRPDGEVRWLSAEFAQVEAAADENRFAGVFRDVTARTQAETARQAERDRLATLFDNLPTPVVKGSPVGDAFIVETVNPAFEQTFGVDAESIEGHDLHDVIVPEGDLERAVEINRTVAREGTIRTEVVRQAAEGKRTFQVHAAVRETDGDGPPEAYAIYTDISDQKRIQEELRRSKEQLQVARDEAEEAARLKSAMLANMSHEVRTPLTSIIGFAELLADTLEDDQGQFARHVHRSSERLMQTLDSVLQLSKLDAGAYQLDREQTDLTELVRDTVDMLRPRAERDDVSVETECPDDPVLGALDRNAVDRILTNLIQNAIKFTEGGGRVCVRLARETEGRALIEIKDTGIGIDDDFLPEAFTAFKQESEGLGRDFEGTGLGLAITHRLVDAHDGEIEVESEKGVGTRVRVRLPL
jgi:PAS domain S-box-containing protein